MEFLLFSIHYLYNYYMVCALLSHGCHVTTLCNIMCFVTVTCDLGHVILSHTLFFLFHRACRQTMASTKYLLRYKDKEKEKR